MRRIARKIQVGSLAMGGDAPISIQSMLNVPTSDVAGNVQQALELQAAGCHIIRVSVPHVQDVRLITALKNAISIPLVADIHFDYRIALACVEAGVDKIRLNPGNIGGADKVRAVAEACAARGVPIRVGVNSGSLEEHLLKKYGSPTPEALCESALGHVGLLEEQNFFNTVISIKSSHVPSMVAAYRLLAEQCSYPLHLGVTEAGTYHAGLAKNAVGIGALLLDGIGDTLRVSLAAAPELEVQAGYDILRAAGLPVPGIEVIACPTCGRTGIPVAEIAAQVEQRLAGVQKPLKVAVMGCVVNGLGEGREADIGIAGGKDEAILFVRGQRVRTLHGDIISQLVQEVIALTC